MIAGNDALGQLKQSGSIQKICKLGLADQDDLQQFSLAGFQIGEQTHLLKHIGC